MRTHRRKQIKEDSELRMTRSSNVAHRTDVAGARCLGMGAYVCPCHEYQRGFVWSTMRPKQLRRLRCCGRFCECAAAPACWNSVVGSCGCAAAPGAGSAHVQILALGAGGRMYRGRLADLCWMHMFRIRRQKK